MSDAAVASARREATASGAIPVVEVTFRTPAAAEVVARIAQRHPDIVVGAGTVVSERDLRRAADAGARVALAPGLSPLLLDRAARLGLAYVPGAMTPSDLQAGTSQGVQTFKFVPAVPGGVSPANLAEWFGEPCVVAVGGTWIARRGRLREGDWAGLRRDATDAVRVADAVREPA